MYLYVFAPGNLLEVLLLLQGLVHLVVRHAETAQAGLNGVQRLRKDHKLGHVRNTDDLSVQLRAKADRLLDLSAVDQPEPRTNTRDTSSQITSITKVLSSQAKDTLEVLPRGHVCGKGHALVNEGERRGAGYVLPLGRSRST